MKVWLLALLLLPACVRTEYIQDTAPPVRITCPESLTWLPPKPQLPNPTASDLDGLVAAYLVDTEQWQEHAVTRMAAIQKQCGRKEAG